MQASKSKMPSSFKAEIRKQQGHSMPEMHYHDFYEIYIQTQGSRDHIIGTSYYRLMPGDVILLKPNMLHQSVSNNPHERSIVYFTEELIKTYFSEKIVAQLLSVFSHSFLTLSSENYYRVMHIVRELIKEDPDDRYNHIATRLADLLLILLENIDNAQELQDRQISGSSISPLVSYVHENYLVLGGIDEIADTFYLSKGHICRTFKTLTGYTIMQYINNLKIQKACQLLLETDRPVADLSLECGFNTVIYFCRTFKNIMNITPTEYRKNFKK